MSRYNILKYSISPQHRPTHRFDCHSTSNNTITTLSSLTYDHLAPDTPPRSQVLAGFSGGSVGFKKGQRGQYEAGYQCAIRVFKLLEELNDQRRPSHSLKVDLYFRGFGQGREALKTALMSSEGDIIRDLIKRIIDRTALKIGGTRAKKTRRL
jgi:small subunit ribosomal protein S11